MPTTADLQARASWKREQAGYGVTVHPGHGYIVTNPNGHAIATPTSLDELRTLADQLYELVWRGGTPASRGIATCTNIDTTIKPACVTATTVLSSYSVARCLLREGEWASAAVIIDNRVKCNPYVGWQSSSRYVSVC